MFAPPSFPGDRHVTLSDISFPLASETTTTRTTNESTPTIAKTDFAMFEVLDSNRKRSVVYEDDNVYKMGACEEDRSRKTLSCFSKAGAEDFT